MIGRYVADGTLFAALLAGLMVVVAWLALAALHHGRMLARVPLRIHVAGTRGKTSVARMIGAGLRAGGRRVLVKTTGTAPLLLLPDGTERPWRRWGPPTIAEQARFFRLAVRLKADAAVLESMAVQPEYLWASERYLVRATDAVITNLRPDHEEALGAVPEDAAAAIALVTPRRGRLYLTPESTVPAVLAAAERRGTAVVRPAGLDDIALSPAAANARLALAVCARLGIAEAVATPAIAGAGEDPGAFFVAPAEAAGRSFRFANAFACNDVASFAQLWDRHQPADAPSTTILFSARPDRPLRTVAFLRHLAALAPEARLVLAGAPPGLARRLGFRADRVHRLRAHRPGPALAELAALTRPGGMVWGTGNYAGIGAALAALVRPAPGGAPC